MLSPLPSVGEGKNPRSVLAMAQNRNLAGVEEEKNEACAARKEVPSIAPRTAQLVRGSSSRPRTRT